MDKAEIIAALERAIESDQIRRGVTSEDGYEIDGPVATFARRFLIEIEATPPASAPDITETFDIDAQLTAARTEGRREGLREAIRVARIHAQYPVTGDYNRGYDKARKDAVRAIEALADQEPAP